MDLQIHEGKVFTFGFDKEVEIRKAKGKRLKTVEKGAFVDLRHQKCPIPEFPESSRTGLSNLPDECRETRRAKGDWKGPLSVIGFNTQFEPKGQITGKNLGITRCCNLGLPAPQTGANIVVENKTNVRGNGGYPLRKRGLPPPTQVKFT